MNELAKRWVAALRSGAYKQGRGRLRCGNEYCSIGVLVDVYDKKRWKKGQLPGSFRDGENMFLPSEDICDAVGMSSHRMRELAFMNDVARDSFNRIADEIERMLEDNDNNGV